MGGMRGSNFPDTKPITDAEIEELVRIYPQASRSGGLSPKEMADTISAELKIVEKLPALIARIERDGQVTIGLMLDSIRLEIERVSELVEKNERLREELESAQLELDSRYVGD